MAYPNPGEDVMNIRTGLRNATISVYDMQGRKVHEQEVIDEITSIDASRWNSGTYIWELGTGNGNENEVEDKILESGKWVK
ncbi:MAG: T9SS type A sorting domain-containing protein [Bacteroidales bacterium]|nr:T9SS type A sorting domain-containing protein [Bacteroidales bacterium]